MMVALRNAHNAGDDVAARRIAAMVSAATPVSGKPVKRAEAPNTLEQDMAQQAKDDVGTALETGIATASSRAVRAAANAMDYLPTNRAMKVVAPETYSKLRAKVDEYLPSERDIQLLEAGTAGSGAAQGANIASEIALTAIPGSKAAEGVMLVPRLGAALAKQGAARTIGRLAATGAAGGATGSAMLGKDVGEGAGWGAALGPTLGGAGKVLSKGYGFGQDLVGGATGRAIKDAQEAFGDRTQQAIAALRNLKGNVAGEAPTAGRAATPELAALKTLESGARGRPNAPEFLARDAQNEAARSQVLEDIAAPGRAGTATQGGAIPLSPASQVRADTTGPMFDAAMADRVPINRQMLELVRGREVQGAIGKGANSFEQAQTNARAGGLPVPKGANLNSVSIDRLQRTKIELDGEIRDLSKASDGASRTKARQLMEARDQLVSRMNAASPNYAAAVNEYRVLSQPQNQADVAASLQTALRGSGGSERPAALLEALRNAPNLLRRADQSNRFQQVEQVMSPAQMTSINGLRNSLDREAQYSNLHAPQGVIPKSSSVFERAEESTPPIFSAMITALRRGAKGLAGQSDRQVAEVIDRAMLDPSKMADLLASTAPQQRNAVVNYLRRVGASPASIGGMSAVASPGQE